jgi:hypothetical protein
LLFFVLCDLCCQFLWIVFVLFFRQHRSHKTKKNKTKTIKRNWQHRSHKTKKNKTKTIKRNWQHRNTTSFSGLFLFCLSSSCVTCVASFS